MNLSSILNEIRVVLRFKMSTEKFDSGNYGALLSF